MEVNRRRLLAMIGTGVSISGCLGDGSGTTTPTETDADDSTASPTAPPDSATVFIRDHPDHGEILVDERGMTLYMFDADTQGDVRVRAPAVVRRTGHR